MTAWPASASGTASRPVPTPARGSGPRPRSARARYRSRSPGSSARSRSYRRARAAAVAASGRSGPRGSMVSPPSGRVAAGLALDGERADRLERGPVGGHRGRLGLVVRRRDLDDVHPGEVDGADDLADGAEHLAGQHPARLGRPGPGRHARVDDVDVEREVDRVGAVERLGDRVGDDGLGAALLDLAHEVPAQALLLHPVEGRQRRPVAAQPDLDEVLALDRARLDQPAHRRAVAGEDAPVVVGGVGVGVEMDDPDAARAADLGDGGRRRPGDRVVAAEDDRDRAGLGDLADLAVDHRVAALDPGRDDVGVAGVDDGQDLERLDVELERVDRARRVLRLADRARPEAGARSVADGVVERRADDRDVDAEAAELGRVRDPGQLHERRRADVGRQVEVAVRLVVARPSRCRARSRGRGRGRSGARPRGPPETAAAHAARIESVSLGGGAAGSHPVVQRGAPERMVAPVGSGQTIRRRGPELRPGRVDERRVARTARTAVWATSVAASSVVSSARGRGGGVAEQDRVAGRALRRDRQVGVDRREDPADVGHVGGAGVRVRRPGRRSRRPPCWPGSARPGRRCCASSGRRRRTSPRPSCRSPARRPRTARGSGRASPRSRPGRRCGA